MQLYHYTSAYHLRGIGQYGLTVGDVPTDMDLVEGRVGVWLTSSPTPDGHGLRGSAVYKSGFRLTVDVPVNGPLHRWIDWAPANTTHGTGQALRTDDAYKDDQFFVYFGWIRPENIVEAIETKSGISVANWATLLPESVSLPGIPFGRRRVWHKGLLRAVRQASSIS